MFSLIVAFDDNKAIGLNDNLPWHIKEDLIQFKNRTKNHRIVMGNKTFKGINKILPDRHTIVVCSKGHQKEDSLEVSYCTDFDKFLIDNYDTDEEIFICGGASIYQKALPYCKKLYISKVKGIHQADTFFPDFDLNNYQLISCTNYSEFDLLEYQKKVL